MDHGTNEVKQGGKTSVIVLRKIPTVFTGTCYLIYFDSKDENEFPFLYIGVNSNIELEDMPRQFTFYFTTKDDWHGVVTENWAGYQYPLKIDTPYQNFPLALVVSPLSREFYYSLESKTNMNQNSKDPCFQSSEVLEILKTKNCTEPCIPIILSALFNKSEIKVCSNFENHNCAVWDIQQYAVAKQKACMKQAVGEYFKGLGNVREGFHILSPELTQEKIKNKMLMKLCFVNSEEVTISEEKLVYDSKDLLAWLGGALGIFIGYSFFDLSKLIIDVTFFFIYKLVNKC